MRKKEFVEFVEFVEIAAVVADDYDNDDMDQHHRTQDAQIQSEGGDERQQIQSEDEDEDENDEVEDDEVEDENIQQEFESQIDCDYEDERHALRISHTNHN